MDPEDKYFVVQLLLWIVGILGPIVGALAVKLYKDKMDQIAGLEKRIEERDKLITSLREQLASIRANNKNNQ